MFCCGRGRLRGISCMCFENKKLSLLGTVVNNFFLPQQNTVNSFMQMILCFMKMQGKEKTGVLESKEKKKR